MTDKKFDLIVIGSGSGGSVAAGKCAKAGWKVAQIDSRPFGGTCARRGCDPKKVLVGAAELIDWNRRMSGNGVPADAHIDWPAADAVQRDLYPAGTRPPRKGDEEAEHHPLSRTGKVYK